MSRLSLDEVDRCAAQLLASGRRPRIAVLLGSGWQPIVQRVADPLRLPYAALPGFPQTEIDGHAGEVVLGRLGAQEVAVLCGRRHAYEGGDPAAMKGAIAALAACGVQVLVQTNAAGSLAPSMPAGSLMLVADHINLVQRSPLMGETGSARFVNMVGAYDAGLRERARALAARRGVPLHEGVYLWCLGPQFETPAEIRLFQQLGAQAVGMSTVPETIIARHAGMRVLALSLLTNMGAGLSDEVLSHAHTLAQAEAASAMACGFLADLLQQL